jgi:hypothetical protein
MERKFKYRGTSNILFPTATTNALYALISPHIVPGTYGIACNKIDTLPAVIDIAFTAQNSSPFNLTALRATKSTRFQ